MTLQELVRKIDISAVSPTSNLVEVEKMCAAAEKYNFIAVFSMPWCTDYVVKRLSDNNMINVGGVVGFPSGAVSEQTKCEQAKDLIGLGCEEIDTVMNIGALKSGHNEYIAHELASIRAITKGKIMKVIIEAPLLTIEEIETASRLVCESGADFIKSGTGWHGATEQEKIRLMCEYTKGKCAVKVAGGVRKLDTIIEYSGMGVTRFGIGTESALNIIDEIIERSCIK